MKKKIFLYVLPVILIVLLVCTGLFYFEFKEFEEIGHNYTIVMLKSLLVKAVTAICSFIIIFLIALSTNLALKRNLNVWDKDINYLKSARLMFIISILLSLGATLFVGETLYSTVIPATNPAWFKLADPILGKNIGYYIFQRPLFIAIVNSFLSIIILFTVYTLFLYILFYIRNGMPKLSYLLEKQRGILVHVSVCIISCLVISAVKFKFMAEDLMFKSNNITGGGGYTDIYVWLNFYRFMPFIIAILILVCLYMLFKHKLSKILYVLAVYPALWILIGITAAFIQNIVVLPNEEVNERIFIRYSIEFTKMAYNLENTVETDYPVLNNLNKDTISKNSEIVDNIRITDYNSTLQAYNHLQALRNYYTFLDADVIPYSYNGQKKAAFIAAREQKPQESEDNKLSYVNKHLKYTHGFGVVASSINRVTGEGQPEFIIKDMPVTKGEGLPEITQPRVYFGETEKDYLIVNTHQKELDYTEGQQEFENSYDGKAGISLGGINRFLFAIRNMDMNMLTTKYIKKDSKLLINTNIKERLNKIAPFIKFSNDPYIVIAKDGSLKWIVDGFTTTKYFPYSQKTGDFNYIRNSVKAVIDAYNGTVDLYIIDYNDPIINSFANAFPGVFKSGGLPYEVAEYNKYPEELFVIQAEIFKKYHDTNPSKFYAKSDFYEIAREKYGTGKELKNVQPYYTLLNIFGSNELFQIVPFTLTGNDNNLVSWLAVGSEGGNYGRFVMYGFSKSSHIYGTMQIENRIDNDPVISKELALWETKDTSVFRGNMLVIPIENSLLYVEPIYLKSTAKGSLPELKRIVLSYGDTVVMEASLQEAFKKLFESYTKPEETRPVPPAIIAPDLPKDMQELIGKTLEKYEEARQFLTENDWVNYGKSMKEFDAFMEEIKQISSNWPLPSPSESAAPLERPAPDNTRN